MSKKITVTNRDGSCEEVDLISSFVVEDLGRNFVILSKGEKIGAASDMNLVHVCEIIETQPNTYSLVSIEDELVWIEVKQAMKKMIDSYEG